MRGHELGHAWLRVSSPSRSVWCGTPVDAVAFDHEINTYIGPVQEHDIA